MAQVPPNSTPGDHLWDSLRSPSIALERAARGSIPLLETMLVAGVGMGGLGLAGLGAQGGAMPAAEQMVRGLGFGLALWAPVLVFLMATNALQPASERAIPFRTSLAIGATAMVLPGVWAMLCGAVALLGRLLGAPEAVEVGVAAAAGTLWLMGVVAMVGIGHSRARGTGAMAGVLAALGGLLITAVGGALLGFVLANPPWATEQTWGFL